MTSLLRWLWRRFRPPRVTVVYYVSVPGETKAEIKANALRTAMAVRDELARIHGQNARRPPADGSEPPAPGEADLGPNGNGFL